MKTGRKLSPRKSNHTTHKHTPNKATRYLFSSAASITKNPNQFENHASPHHHRRRRSTSSPPSRLHRGRSGRVRGLSSGLRECCDGLLQRGRVRVGRNAGGGRAAGDPRLQCGIRFVFGYVCDAVASAHSVNLGGGEEDGGAKEKLKRMEVFWRGER